MYIRAFAVFVVCLLGTSSAVRGDDVMRCDQVLIKVGMIAGEVLAKCGEPKSKLVEDVPIRAFSVAVFDRDVPACCVTSVPTLEPDDFPISVCRASGGPDDFSLLVVTLCNTSSS